MKKYPGQEPLRIAEAAATAAGEFNRVVRRKEVPAVALPDGVLKDGGVRVDKLLPKIGLAESVSDATRKIEAGAVEINGERLRDLTLAVDGGELLVRS